MNLLLPLRAALITACVGLALFGPLVGSLRVALGAPDDQISAVTITFSVGASGLSMFGIGAAPWSLVAGLALLGLTSWCRMH